MAGWSGGDPEVITAAVATVHRVAAAVLAALKPDTGPLENEDGAGPGEHELSERADSYQVA